MNIIKILPENLANQIAAGEVVERPASVVKELVENSLDAGAKRIKVEIELGGRRLVRVTDDGCGMVRDDAILAFERHATSKIAELGDLAKIETLGFRGEALASIASVAKVELVTKFTDDSVASRVFVEGGRLVDVKETGRPTGTTITVRDLFFNTPARRKFMRSHATENFHITNNVTHYALANPKIAFTLTSNGREIFRIAPAKTLRERAFQLFGNEMIESLLPVKGGREFVANVSGFISAPRTRRTTRDSQYFFINGRYVKDKIVAGGLLEGFRSVLPHGVYPVAFLFLEIPFEEIDVNVHPAKTEVRFRRAEAVKDVISAAIRESLQNAGILKERETETAEFTATVGTISRAASATSQGDGSPSETPQVKMEIPEKNETNQNNMDFSIPATSNDFESLALDRSQNDVSPPDQGEMPVGLKTASNLHDSSVEIRKTEKNSLTNSRSRFEEIALPPVDSAYAIPNAIEVDEISASKIQPLAQLHESFIIAVDDEGLLLIDQHVAHERILFDKFRQKETTRNIESQNLLIPETIDLSPAQTTAFEEVREELEFAGFGLMKLSGRTIAIKSVPTDLPANEAKNLFSEILETVEKDKKGNAKATLRDDIAASMACKAAVKINMKLSPEKMRWMIDKLLTTSSPTTCPHGRPVILRLSMKDIERKFHRT